MDVSDLNLTAADQVWDGENDTQGYRYRVAAIGPRLGASLMGGSLYELPPGEKNAPYHYELGCEEWLLVVSGRPTLRSPDGEQELAPGDVAVFPEGPAGAHQVVNRTRRVGAGAAAVDEGAGRRRPLPRQRQGERVVGRRRRPADPAHRAAARLLGGRGVALR